MGKKSKLKQKSPGIKRPTSGGKNIQAKPVSLWPWIFFLAGITFIALSPMLKNEFTNWDDEFYVINNELLRGPDWKGIFTQPVVGNYHPLTVITLAINYQIGELTPFSYMLVNLLFHLINTCLVFYFIWIISDKKIWVAFLSALIFGLHPMHVESVAWVSERKDVLYTFFFLLSLLRYWKFLQTGKSSHLWFCFFWFLLSLLSKPAAIILPMVLFLLDYWKGRAINKRMLIEKIPFFLLALLFGVITMKIQTVAMAGLSYFPIWERLLFASYVIMIYFLRFFVPYPLSAFHPYPSPDHIGWPILISPLFILALAILLWYLRKNKLVVFSLLFFIVNLLLVSQIISIGLTIVSERYTYVPYIGLAFLFSMLLNKYKPSIAVVKWGAPVVVTLVFGVMSFQRTMIWRNSGLLWTDVIKHFPDAPYARTNRANYVAKQALLPENKDIRDSLYRQSLGDCALALKIKPNHAKAYEQRALIYMDLKRKKEAFFDADSLIKLDPKNRLGYYLRGTLYAESNETDKALADFNQALTIDPDYAQALNNRGTLFLNYYKKLTQALEDFNSAISINPQGNYYLNRSICYYKLGDLQKAKNDAQQALQMGAVVPDNYRKLLNL